MRILNTKIIRLFIIISFLFYSCKNDNSNKEKSTEKHEEHQENTNVTTLTLDQLKSIKFELSSIEKKQLTKSLKANGILDVPNNNKATITTIIGGAVKNIFVKSGDYVKKGQIIASIINPTFIKMQEEYLSTLIGLTLSEAEYKRQQELLVGNATALKTLQVSEAELKSYKIKKAGLQKQLELIGLNPALLTSDNMQTAVNVVSPISGDISNIFINTGTYLDANTAIAEVIDNSQLHLDLFVYERNIGKLEKGQIIHFTLTNNPSKEYDAIIESIGNTFEQNTKAVAIHAKVKGDKTGLIDGMNVTALVSLENVTVDAIPTEAIVNYLSQDFIFIVKDNNENDNNHKHNEKEKPTDSLFTFERIPIVKGITYIGYSEITLLKEIPKNAKIATKGAFFILAKMINTGEHEH